MELKPFPVEAWSALTDWKNGSAITASETSGKVVCIVTWSDFHPASLKAFQSARRLSERYGKDGLVMIGVHSANGWAEAAKPAAPEGAIFRLAHDSQGEFRKAIKSDGDPDFYLIDRAGQLRYADITSDSVEGAVQLLVSETGDVASNINAKMAADKAASDALSRRAETGRSEVDFTKIPILPFAKPSADEYKRASWPKTPRDTQGQDSSKRLDPRPVTLPTSDWYPSKPNSDGRITVAYFWHPDILFTYDKTVGEVDRLQKLYGRDVNFVGVLVIPQSNTGTELKDEQKDPERLKKRLKEFTVARKYEHYLTFDAGNVLWTTLATENPIPIPFYVVIGSDSVARWWSSLRDGLDPGGAILKMIENDPGVKARRKAEDAWIKTKGG
jgi:hypothetical protein